MNLITEVEKNSIAEELGIEPGDCLCSINGQSIKDVFDYRYAAQEEELVLLVQKRDGEEWELEIEKDENEDLGLVFESGLMDKARSCANKCIFCFIDQLPPNMRETLYFKDDDSRLSFLSGNYVTLTNMTDDDFAHILFYHLSPINISVHTTDPALRRYMLKNPAAERLMPQMKKLYDANIEMNFQIVLCKGVNDGAQLDKTIGDLTAFLPNGKSLSVVPVGITKYREGLYPMEPFTQEEALAVVRQVEAWQEKLKAEKGTAFVFAADEFYLKAGVKIPPASAYEDFPQIENGVGMLALLRKEFNRALAKADENEPVSTRKKVIVTGKLAEKSIRRLVRKAAEKFPALDVTVIGAENWFFGSEITVSGLLCGQDMYTALKDVQAEEVLIPKNALRADDTVFLDDMDIAELSQKLGVPVKAVEADGKALLAALQR